MSTIDLNDYLCILFGAESFEKNSNRYYYL